MRSRDSERSLERVSEAPASPSGRLLATVTLPAEPELVSVISSVSVEITTLVSGWNSFSVTVSASRSVSTVTLTRALSRPTRAVRSCSISAFSLASCLAASPVALTAGESVPGARIMPARLSITATRVGLSSATASATR